MGRGGRQRFKSRKKCNSSASKSHDDDDDDDHAKKQKANSKSCKVISKLLLPEEMMFDILSLVPLKWLLNSARYVCKPWATIIGTSQFAEAPLHHARAKPALYVEDHLSASNSYFLDIKDGVNGQFERTDLGTPPRMGGIVNTCDGILLLYGGSTGYFVVNPILKCWLRIPPLSISQVYLSGFGHLTIARVPRTAKFKLFFVDVLTVSSVDWWVFYVLRIGIDNSWKEIARKESPGKRCIVFEDVCGGNDVYWITTKGVIVMDVDKEIIVGEYPHPFPPRPVNHPPIDIFLWMGNCLSCIEHKDKGMFTRYQIYILDIDSGKWTPYHEMGPFDYVASCGYELDIMYVVFYLWIKDQIIIGAIMCRKFLECWERIFFGYNVKTKQLTKIEGIVLPRHFKVWLHTNSLVSLPSTLT